MGPEWLCAGSVGHLLGGIAHGQEHILLQERSLQVPVCSQCCELLGAEGLHAGPVTCLMSPLQYKVLLYSLDGRLLSAYCAYEWSLGIKSVAWSPSSQFLAIGSYDGKVGSGSGLRTAAAHELPARHSHSSFHRCAS